MATTFENAAKTRGKLDLLAEHKSLYLPSSDEVVVVDVPVFRFLMIDGAGDPNTAQAYRDAVEALYSVAYAVKFMVRDEQGLDARVMPLEGLWWADDMAEFSANDKDRWLWTMMIAQPEVVTPDHVARAIERVAARKPLAVLARMRFDDFHEGLCVQIMHHGPYSAEGPAIARLHAFIRDHGYAITGKHHEIYLSDARRSAPERLKTIVRQPIRPA